jgi:mitochondrial fission protein ELM1
MTEADQRSRVVIAADGRRGHQSQSQVLARMLGDDNPVVMRIRAADEATSLPELLLRLRFAAGYKPGRSAAGELVKRLLRPEDGGDFRDLAHDVKGEGDRLRILTVSAGTSAATMNLLLQALLGSDAVCAMTPSLLPRSRFAVNVVPAHDVHAGFKPPPNVIVSPLALSYHDVRAAERRAARLRAELQLPENARILALAIGGPSKSCKWDEEHIGPWLERVVMDYQQAGWQILATTSRRTPQETTLQLHNLMHTCPGFVYLLDASVDSYNPLPAFYELASTVMVTGDSFNMISETIQAGHTPTLLDTSARGSSGKLGRAITDLRRQGLLVSATADLDPRNAQQLERRVPNAEYEKLRAAVVGRLGLA